MRADCGLFPKHWAFLFFKGGGAGGALSLAADFSSHIFQTRLRTATGLVFSKPVLKCFRGKMARCNLLRRAHTTPSIILKLCDFGLSCYDY